jgi:hypothetical protein
MRQSKMQAGGLAINHWDARSGMRDQYRKEGKGRDASATGMLEAESSGSRLRRAKGEPDVMSKQPRSALRWPGILQQMINVALELFHLGQEFGLRSVLHLQQEHGELCQR